MVKQRKPLRDKEGPVNTKRYYLFEETRDSKKPAGRLRKGEPHLSGIPSIPALVKPKKLSYLTVSDIRKPHPLTFQFQRKPYKPSIFRTSVTLWEFPHGERKFQRNLQRKRKMRHMPLYTTSVPTLARIWKV